MTTKNETTSNSFNYLSQEAYAVTYKELYQQVKACIETNEPLFIWGATGIGKTAVVNKYAEDTDAVLLDLFLAARESIDVGGLPYKDAQDRMAIALPRLIPLVGEDCPKIVIVFLDELPDCDDMMKRVAYKVVDEGRVGDTLVHPNVRFIGAGNRVKDKSGSSSLPPPLLDRFCHVELDLDPQGWLEWAKGEGNIHPIFTGFIEEKPNRLHVMMHGDDYYSKSIKGLAFFTNRSYEKASKRYNWALENGMLDKNFLLTSMASILGSPMAREWMLHYEQFESLPSIQSIFEGTAETDGLELTHAQQYYLCHAIMQSFVQRIPDDMRKELFSSGMGCPRLWEEEWRETYLNNSFDFMSKSCTIEMQSAFLTLMIEQAKQRLTPKLREVFTIDHPLAVFLHNR